MSRITITIDDALVEEAMKVYGVTSPSEAIQQAVREALRRHRLTSALDHRGRIDLDLDQERLQQMRWDGMDLVASEASRASDE